MGLKEVRRLLSSEHFPVDGKLIEAFHVENVGVDEELPVEGWIGRTAVAGSQRRARLSQGAAHERDSCLDERSRGAALSQSGGPREPAVLPGSYDGRARTLGEAIRWHDGEARPARLALDALTAADRTALAAFLVTSGAAGGRRVEADESGVATALAGLSYQRS